VHRGRRTGFEIRSEWDGGAPSPLARRHVSLLTPKTLANEIPREERNAFLTSRAIFRGEVRDRA
jgi:hypothetical protein